MVPVLLFAEIGELLVARVEPEDVSFDGLGMHTVDDHPDKFSGLATPEVHLIAGAQVDATVVEAIGNRTVRGGRLLGEHKVELQNEIFESCLGNEAPAFLTWSGLPADNDALLHFPSGVGWVEGRTAAHRNRPAVEILVIEKRLPRLRRLQRYHKHETRQGDDLQRNAFHRISSILKLENLERGICFMFVSGR